MSSAGGGGIVGALAGAAAPVHAAVRDSFLRGAGAGAGRADAMEAVAVPGAPAGGDDPVDQPARRILRGDRAGGGIRRGRTGADGADGQPGSARAGVAAGQTVFRIDRKSTRLNS